MRTDSWAATTGIAWCHNQHRGELEPALQTCDRHDAVCWNRHCSELQSVLWIAATISAWCYDKHRVTGEEVDDGGDVL